MKTIAILAAVLLSGCTVFPHQPQTARESSCLNAAFAHADKVTKPNESIAYMMDRLGKAEDHYIACMKPT